MNSNINKKRVDEFSPIYIRKLYKNREKGQGVLPYGIDWGDFSAKSVEVRSRGPGWKRQAEVKKTSKTPRLLFREEARSRDAAKIGLGPGTYTLPDAITEVSRKPGSKKGVMDAKPNREHYSDVPAPGTYGKGGVPSRELEESLTRSAGNKGMLECHGKIKPAVGGSGLAPNRYDTNDSGIQRTLNKVVSLKGPYELFTTNRSVYNVGYLATGRSPYIGTEVGLAENGLDKWNDADHRHLGKFLRSEQRPAHPTDRMFLCDPVLAYKPPSFPAPGAYDPKLPKWESPNRNPPPFLSTSTRNDKRSLHFFMPHQNSCAVGRYRPERYEPKTINGCTSAFKSKTKPPGFLEYMYRNERIKPKNQPSDRKEHLVKPLVTQDILKKAGTLLPCQRV